MGKLLSEISEKEADFIASQKIFFVATAPRSDVHHVSVSPKAPGNGCVVLDPHNVAYADLTGSGAETAAHVLQNGRMTLMFCNIEEGPPKILRLFGKAELILAENLSPQLRSKFPKEITNSFGFRAVYKLNVTRVTTSCGYTLPIMSFEKYRQTGKEWCENKGKDGMFDYATQKNCFSIDGLPSLGLLRKDCPFIEPVAEDGFILGKPSKDCSEPAIKDTTAMIRQAMEQAHRMHASEPYRVSLGFGKLTVLLMFAFSLGSWFGACFL